MQPSRPVTCVVSTFCSQQLEWRALSMVRGMSDQLRSACSNVVSSVQGLPGTVQDQITSARQSAEDLYSSLGSTSAITPIILERSRHQLTQVQSTFMLPALNLPTLVLLCVYVVIEVRECVLFSSFPCRCNSLWMASWSICSTTRRSTGWWDPSPPRSQRKPRNTWRRSRAARTIRTCSFQPFCPQHFFIHCVTLNLAYFCHEPP